MISILRAFLLNIGGAQMHCISSKTIAAPLYMCVCVRARVYLYLCMRLGCEQMSPTRKCIDRKCFQILLLLLSWSKCIHNFQIPSTTVFADSSCALNRILHVSPFSSYEQNLHTHLLQLSAIASSCARCSAFLLSLLQTYNVFGLFFIGRSLLLA